MIKKIEYLTQIIKREMLSSSQAEVEKEHISSVCVSIRKNHRMYILHKCSAFIMHLFGLFMMYKKVENHLNGLLLEEIHLHHYSGAFFIFGHNCRVKS